MVIGGMWHGANWNFVIWGALHGFGLALVRLWQSQSGTAKARVGPNSVLWRYASIILTFHYVAFAWIFFRAPSFDVALAILGRIASLSVSFPNISGPLTLVLVIGALAHYVPKKWYDWSLTLYVRAPFYAQATALAMVALGVQNVVQSGVAPFIYTKF
jgi:D-alanyl-lipoteichoic acid acyltransferase DltB (MBOAT superfamily)